MTDALKLQTPAAGGPTARRLNQACFCLTLDRQELGLALDGEAGEVGFFERLTEHRPHLLSNAPVFMAASSLVAMQEIVEAIEATAGVPAYRDAVLSWAPEIAQKDHGPAGALMGYDFHLDDDGPKLIADAKVPPFAIKRHKASFDHDTAQQLAISPGFFADIWRERV